MTATADAARASTQRAVDIQVGAEGSLVAAGELSFATARAACIAGARAVRAAATPTVTIDCGGVTRADSAGVAVLVEWLRVGRKAGREVRYVNLPSTVVAIARLSELDSLLAGS